MNGRTKERKVILRSSCAFGKVGSPLGKTKTVWATTQCGSTEGSSICITELLFSLSSCIGTVEDGRRPMSVLSCHQLVVHQIDRLVGICWTFYFTNMDAVRAVSAWQDGGIFAYTSIWNTSSTVTPAHLSQSVRANMKLWSYSWEKATQPLLF